MQISPTSTLSHQLRDPLVDDHMLMTWLVTRSLVQCRFMEKILCNGVGLCICTWFVL